MWLVRVTEVRSETNISTVSYNIAVAWSYLWCLRLCVQRKRETKIAELNQKGKVTHVTPACDWTITALRRNKHASASPYLHHDSFTQGKVTGQTAREEAVLWNAEETDTKPPQQVETIATSTQTASLFSLCVWSCSFKICFTLMETRIRL